MTDLLQVAVLVADAVVIVLVPLLVLLLASRVRNAVSESSVAALASQSDQHEKAFALAAHQHERSAAETTRLHARAIAEYARQHERAMAELGAEHMRIAQEFGMFSQKRHEVYARLYARYRRATRDFAAALTGPEPEFQRFSRDDLLRYLQTRKVREREAADAIAAMDRGDFYAMGKLTSRLHWRVTLRDANAAFERARDYESLNELYLSDAVCEAVGNVRRKVEALAFALMRDQERADASTRTTKQDELHAGVASLLAVMRKDLRGRDDPATEPRRRGELALMAPSTGSMPSDVLRTRAAVPADRR